jgi:hypothetical protein
MKKFILKFYTFLCNDMSCESKSKTQKYLTVNTSEGECFIIFLLPLFNQETYDLFV